jgi:hypothetical protein
VSQVFKGGGEIVAELVERTPWKEDMGKRIYHIVDTSRCGVEEQDGYRVEAGKS